jgi:hypothetical protein
VELVACAFAQAVREGAACAGSPLSQDPNIDAQLKVLAPRVKAFAGDTRTLNDSVATLLATAPAATPSPAAPAPAQKGKKADTKR